jgi:hypothetical protein
MGFPLIHWQYCKQLGRFAVLCLRHHTSINHNDENTAVGLYTKNVIRWSSSISNRIRFRFYEYNIYGNIAREWYWRLLFKTYNVATRMKVKSSFGFHKIPIVWGWLIVIHYFFLFFQSSNRLRSSRHNESRERPSLYSVRAETRRDTRSINKGNGNCWLSVHGIRYGERVDDRRLALSGGSFSTPYEHDFRAGQTSCFPQLRLCITLHVRRLTSFGPIGFRSTRTLQVSRWRESARVWFWRRRDGWWNDIRISRIGVLSATGK